MPYNTIIAVPIIILILCTVAYLMLLVIRALRKYISSKEVRREKRYVAESLGDAIRKYRADNKMTQEFVAEALGVSRQAVSKWESGTSDPSTSNLLELAKLFGVSAEEILQNIQNKREEAE